MSGSKDNCSLDTPGYHICLRINYVAASKLLAYQIRQHVELLIAEMIKTHMTEMSSVMHHDTAKLVTTII